MEELRGLIRRMILETTRERIAGGLASQKSLKDIADHHGVDLTKLKAQLDKGIQVEMEHTDERETAREIAMDHLMEDPAYYDKLEKVEKH